jgi:hypothetical protein
MKQTITWLALTLLFAATFTLSIAVGSFRPAATTTDPDTAVAATPPIVTANATPAQPGVPVVLLDDVPPKPAGGSQALARWIVDPNALPATRATEKTVPSPPAPATTASIAGQPSQDSKAGLQPPEGSARLNRTPQDSKAELPGKRLKRTASARGCGSASGRFADLMRRLHIAPRCTARRSAEQIPKSGERRWVMASA